MADFVRDHIGFGKAARLVARAGVEFVLHVPEERHVQVDILILRAIERPHRRLRHAAAAVDRAVIEPQPHRMISPPHTRENVGPAVLGVAEHRGDKILGLGGARIVCGRRAALLHDRAAAGEDFRTVDQHTRIDAERPADQAENDDGADPETVRTARHAEATARAGAAIVLDIARTAEFIPTHLFLLHQKVRRGGVSLSGKTVGRSRRINQVFPGIYCLAAPSFQ